MTANAFHHPPVHSPWFTLADQAPWEPGVYEVTGEALIGDPLFSYWDGEVFNYVAYRSIDDAFERCARPGGGPNVTRWRGIIPPSRLPRFVSETWNQAIARVPAVADFRDKPVTAHLAEVCYLLDCMPGYELHQVLNLPPQGVVVLYRRRDPS